MTLVTHLWTDKVNIIAADGRMSADGVVITEDLLKVRASKKSFIAYYGRVYIDPERNITTELSRFLEDSKATTPNKIAKELKDHFDEVSPEQDVGFMLGAQSGNKTHAHFLKINEGIKQNEKTDNGCAAGVRFNYECEKQRDKIKVIFEECFQKYGYSYIDYYTYNNIKDSDFINIIKDIYTRIEKDPIANHNNMIGPLAALGVIRKGKFYWLYKRDSLTNDINNESIVIKGKQKSDSGILRKILDLFKL